MPSLNNYIMGLFDIRIGFLKTMLVVIELSVSKAHFVCKLQSVTADNVYGSLFWKNCQINVTVQTISIYR